MESALDDRYTLATKEQHMFAAHPKSYQEWRSVVQFLQDRQPWYSSDWFTHIDVRDGSIISIDRRYA